MLLTDAVLPLEEAGVLLPDALPDAPEEPELLPGNGKNIQYKGNHHAGI